MLHAATIIPETHVPRNGFDGVLEHLGASPARDRFGRTATNTTFYGNGLLEYCYGAVMKKIPWRRRWKNRRHQLLRRHSRRQYDYHRNSHAKAAMAT